MSTRRGATLLARTTTDFDVSLRLTAFSNQIWAAGNLDRSCGTAWFSASQISPSITFAAPPLPPLAPAQPLQPPKALETAPQHNSMCGRHSRGLTPHLTQDELQLLYAIALFLVGQGHTVMPSKADLRREWTSRRPSTTRQPKSISHHFRKFHTSDGPRDARPITPVSDCEKRRAHSPSSTPDAFSLLPTYLLPASAFPTPHLPLAPVPSSLATFPRPANLTLYDVLPRFRPLTSSTSPPRRPTR